MASTRKLLTWCLLSVLVPVTLTQGQSASQTSISLGKAIDRALKQSSLTQAGAKPFHLKVHIFESTNPSSEYHAEIEEFWMSDQQWRRSIDSPSFKQTTIVSGNQISEENRGEYYPLWLKDFVSGIFDPVPHAEQWRAADAKIVQLSSPSKQVSQTCSRITVNIGSEIQTDAFATVCFDSAGLFEFVGFPGYNMEFHDYKRFDKVMVARRYQADLEPGTSLVANIILLEELKDPDAAMFSVQQSTPAGQTLHSLYLSQSTIEHAAGKPTIVWPPVQSGKTSGVLCMYISVDRQGQVREAYPLNSDNPGLQDAARDQLLKWKLKPMAAKGVQVQVEAPLAFRFETTLAPNPK